MNDMTTWNVLLNSEIIDTVIYDCSMSKTEVKRGLVSKGYDKSIKLEKTNW